MDAIDLNATSEWLDPEDRSSEIFRNISSINNRHATLYQRRHSTSKLV